MTDEIVPADPKLRSRLLWWSGSAVVAGLLFLAMLYLYLREIARVAEVNPAAATESAVRMVTGLGWVCGACLVGMALWFGRLAEQVSRTGRYPPPGRKVLRDTPVRTGRKAASVAAMAGAAAIVCLLAGTLGAWYFCQLMIGLLRG